MYLNFVKRVHLQLNVLKDSRTMNLEWDRLLSLWILERPFIFQRWNRGTSMAWGSQSSINVNIRYFTIDPLGKPWGTCIRKGKESEVAQSCPTLRDPMDCSLSGSSIHGIFQARVLEWIAISFSRGSSRPRNWTWVSRIAGRCFTVWATRAPVYLQGKFLKVELLGWRVCIYNFLTSLPVGPLKRLCQLTFRLFSHTLTSTGMSSLLLGFRFCSSDRWKMVSCSFNLHFLCYEWRLLQWLRW